MCCKKAPLFYYINTFYFDTFFHRCASFVNPAAYKFPEASTKMMNTLLDILIMSKLLVSHWLHQWPKEIDITGI